MIFLLPPGMKGLKITNTTVTQLLLQLNLLPCNQMSLTALTICGALRDLVPFVQFKKREKHPWRSVNFSKVAGFSLQLY